MWRDAEMLLLVHDQEAEIVELDRLAEQRMGADDDIDIPFCDALLYARQVLAGHEPRGLRDFHRKTVEALGKSLRVLAGQKCSGHDHRDLLAAHRGNEGRAQRHFGLAESDVAADQPVHGTAGSEFTQDHVDRCLLVVGFLVGKAGAELVVGPMLHAQARRLTQLPFGGDLDQLVGDLANAAFHARLARLPSAAAKPVELDVGLFRPVAGEQFDVLDRQEQLVAAGIVELKAIVRRAGGFDRAQAHEAADPMIDMDDQVAGREARHLGDEVFRPV